ncbi:hypothetical protein D3Z48_04280 [Clostridiaceae bacterium]|nr:hypothetical protein [Clostridiaceae bacterium]
MLFRFCTVTSPPLWQRSGWLFAVLFDWALLDAKGLECYDLYKSVKAGGKVRFTDIELEYSDILWFAVDRNGYLAGFTSGGTLFVPEFVRKSKEEAELLETFFVRSCQQ